MKTAVAKGNDMEMQAQTGSPVNVRRKPKARPPRTNVLTINAVRNARLACLSPEFIFTLTKKVSDGGGPGQSKLRKASARRHSLHCLVSPWSFSHIPLS